MNGLGLYCISGQIGAYTTTIFQMVTQALKLARTSPGATLKKTVSHLKVQDDRHFSRWLPLVVHKNYFLP